MARTLAVAATVGAGALAAMQAPINARLARVVGSPQAAVISFGVGLVVLVIVAALWSGGLGQLTRVAHQPWWYFIGGALGAIYVTVALITVRTLGAAGITAGIIAGQLGLSVVIDRLGWFGVARQAITPARIGGLVLLAAGVLLVVRR